MNQLRFFIAFPLVLFALQLIAQNPATGKWKNGKQCAVCFTYDDALNVHLDVVVKQLNRYGFKGTFYVPGYAECLDRRMYEWRAVARDGHELGNHTMFHPCAGVSKKRDWVTPEKDLDRYTTAQFINELKASNTLLKAIDGKTKRTFAYTCGDTVTGEGSFMNDIPKYFTGARGVSAQLLQPGAIDVYLIPAFSFTDANCSKMIPLVDEAIGKGALLVFLFHGVGGGHGLNVDAARHEELLKYVSKRKNQIWVDTFGAITDYLRAFQKK